MQARIRATCDSVSKEDSKMKMYGLLLMASQHYEEQDKTQNGIVDNVMSIVYRKRPREMC